MLRDSLSLLLQHLLLSISIWMGSYEGFFIFILYQQRQKKEEVAQKILSCGIQLCQQVQVGEIFLNSYKVKTQQTGDRIESASQKQVNFQDKCLYAKEHFFRGIKVCPVDNLMLS